MCSVFATVDINEEGYRYYNYDLGCWEENLSHGTTTSSFFIARTTADKNPKWFVNEYNLELKAEHFSTMREILDSIDKEK